MLDNEYEIIEKNDGDMEPILLTDESPYAGVVYQYGSVRLVEDEAAQVCRVVFEFEVFENPNNKDVETEQFKKYVGEILHELIMQTFADV